MSSFFTVNIALHFLFNWRVEKFKYSPIRVSSSHESKGKWLGAFKSRGSLLGRQSSASVAPAPDVISVGKTPRGADFPVGKTPRSTMKRAGSVQNLDMSRGKSQLVKQTSFQGGVPTAGSLSSSTHGGQSILIRGLSKLPSDANLDVTDAKAGSAHGSTPSRSSSLSFSFNIHQLLKARGNSYVVEEKHDGGPKRDSLTTDNKRPSHKGSALLALPEEPPSKGYSRFGSTFGGMGHWTKLSQKSDT